MKIAYLILAHSNFNHLNLLLEELSNPEDHIFLHIDKKIKAIPAFPSGIQNLHFIENRIRSRWVSYSTVATINMLLKEAFTKTDADYFITLSGGDFPVKPLSKLKNFLKEGGEFINMVKGTTESRPDAWFNKFYFEFDRRARTSPSTQIYYRLEKWVNRYYKKSIPFELYTGLDWFALSRGTVNYILNTIGSTDKYDKFFKNTYGTSEAYYQTIIGNSGLNLKIKPSITYTDWSKEEKPAYMTQEHVDFFKNNDTHETPYGVRNFFFARKFHDGALEVTRRISNELLHNNE